MPALFLLECEFLQLIPNLIAAELGDHLSRVRKTEKKISRMSMHSVYIYLEEQVNTCL
jgi:hypothetical protein